MGTLWFGEIKKQASLFLHDKYNVARLVLTDVTETELLVEEVTNDDPSSPDAKTMTKIADASFNTVDYWRIVDVLHRKIGKREGEMKKWREAYKAMVLLEFLLTHGPLHLPHDFLYDLDHIRFLSTFQYVDDKGFDWGAKVQKKADQIQTLLLGKEELREARLKALKITAQINGFGNSASFSTPSPPPSPASSSPLKSSGITLTEREAVSESDSLIGDKDERNRAAGEETLISGICSKLAGFSPLKKLHGGRTPAGFHSLSNVERVSSKCYDRRNSIGY
ncbi:epsin-1 [Brassica rapa]|uniref:ENTH domain-containing protein n=1 Tax=Brassica campestris TaxID=3711 RepID=M4DEL9_BRACM|nr:epsin-1 [Brassica rapa]